MQQTTSLANQFLIAMPGTRDPLFKRSVAFVCQHGEDGAMGLLVNRLSEYRLGDVLAQMNIKSDLSRISEAPVLIGGPVQPERGFVLHSPPGDWESSYKVSERLCVTTSRDVLAAMARGEGPRDAFIALGYAGWEAGQLERELLDNAWLAMPVDENILFSVPFEDRWHAVWRQLGVDVGRISPVAGHA